MFICVETNFYDSHLIKILIHLQRNGLPFNNDDSKNIELIIIKNTNIIENLNMNDRSSVYKYFLKYQNYELNHK